MTFKQKLLAQAYPLLMKLIGSKHKGVQVNTHNVPPTTSMYDIPCTTGQGNALHLSAYQGKYILIVNTASNCGFTKQYQALEALYQAYHNKLVILAIPSNDFKQQEAGSNEDIANFCSINYGITFPILAKCVVVTHAQQHPLYTWLSTAALNGWNNAAPAWNFHKYLINTSGTLICTASSSVNPLDQRITNCII